MKKLMISAAIVLGSLSAFATTVSNQNFQVQSSLFQEGYTEVETVPDAVKKALETAHPGAVLGKAYINAKKEYKLEITVGSQKATVYADANGNWINK
ncbi:hypothetical protein QLS91_04160 [Flavobacterium sp. LB2P84]|jgi:hypothetical protein|uniref:DUF2874 domain-containing protein n=1 Tax=Flavobacterium yafengii TaxID=3041253 RepID=A0AAW6TIF5_9FLAO|nr:hypothetical protein [Flavobacterium yafengii]MDI5896590.1 hypothetical protein [Flavobacterium yafengii]MDI5948689.1 hypothetical protein [Flavobacterium yafengii]MDI6032259.1 hypothetical protein [Flavobacterium yafengii]MDI6045311.1 hypothetical protein [Flavobacterium yafengii]